MSNLNALVPVGNEDHGSLETSENEAVPMPEAVPDVLKQYKITYVVETVCSFPGATEQRLLQQIEKAKAMHSKDQSSVAPAFVGVLEKIGEAMPVDSQIRVLLGEVTSHIIGSQVPKYYPQADGMQLRVSRVQYSETAERLDPPADAVPQVVQLGDRHQA